MLVPLAAEVLAAANVRNGIGHSSVQKTQTRYGKRRINGDAVGPVAVKQRGHGAVHGVGGAYPRNGDLGAIWSGSPVAFGHKLTGIVAAHHLLLLQQATLPGAHVVLVGRSGRHQRGIAVAHPLRVFRRVAPCVERIRLFGLINFKRRRTVPRSHHQANQSFRTLLCDHVVFEQLHAFQQDIRTVLQNGGPRGRLLDWRFEEGIVLTAVDVASDVPAIAKVACPVFYPHFAWAEYLKGPRWLI